jgi:hypothetical protein
VNEEELRKEAVRRRRLAESPEAIAADLGRTSRWVHKWVARHEESSHEQTWASSRSRGPHTSPTRTSDESSISSAGGSPWPRSTPTSTVTAFIKVRSRRVVIATIDGEVVYDGPFPMPRMLR